MRRRNRDGAKREKTIILLSSVFVMAVLTVTGLVIKGNSEDKNDGYVVDFSKIENESNELADNKDTILETPKEAGTQEIAGLAGIQNGAVTGDDLDYDPYFQETTSENVENPDNGNKESDKKTENGKDKDKEKNEKSEEGMFDENLDTAKAEVARMEEMEDTMAIATSIQPALTFNDNDTLAWPIAGNVLINYSMDKTVYFPTLQQYKYNPAIVISAVEGEAITAAANGKITGVYTDPELGNMVSMELGGGYEITYGQLKDITVSEGGYVNKGDIIGSVAAPTKYFIVEGNNVYFKLTKDGIPVNPMTKLN